MAKVIRNVFISFCGIFAFFFAGFFFAGCGVDYSKIQLSSDQTSVELEVGESVDINFKIENYQDGFSNKVSVENESSIFSCSAPIYVAKDQIRITVTAVAGGNGVLNVKTLEAGKSCSVDVAVNQYSKTLESGNDTLYVSDNTEFVPNESLFRFDNNTTEKGLTYFYFQPKMDFNFNTYYLNRLDLENNLAVFTNGVGGVADGNIKVFDSVKLSQDVETDLILCRDGEEEKIDLVNKFYMLTVYDYSVENADYERILYCISEVNVLPSLEVKISGGYINPATGYADFEPLTDNNIKIVPNNPDMLQYILKIEMINSVVDAPISIVKHQSNNHVDFDVFDYVEAEDVDTAGKMIQYWKISQNVQTQTETELGLNIFYDIAQDIEDESVNVECKFDVDIEIAPTALTVNGTSEPEKMVLYNYYRFPEFGWNELFLDVISSFDATPNFDGVYFTFDSKYIDLIYEGVTVSSGSGKLYTDLSKSFYVRGKYGASQAETQLVVHLKSDILQGKDELSLTIDCSIIEGATLIQEDEQYQDYRYYYLDLNAGGQEFSHQIYADQKFQFTTSQFLSGLDVVDIVCNSGIPYLAENNRYYLNLNVVPKVAGIGIYRVFLDNGMFVDLTFNIVKTLQPATSSITLANEGNEAVSFVSYAKEENSNFDNIVNLEILNPSNKDSITYGNSAYLHIDANVVGDGIRMVPDDGKYLAVSRVGSDYRITTLENGNTSITVRLTGVNVENFATKVRELRYFVNVSSYSLVDEYYLKNGESYALSNNVYFGDGDLQEEDVSTTLSVVANNENSSNFYQYFFKQNAFSDIFDNAIENSASNTYTYEISNDQIYSEMVKEKFNKKFVYFFAQNERGGVKDSTITEVVVSKTYMLGSEVKTESKNIMLVLNNGLMFFASDFDFAEKNEIGETIASYQVKFSNVFSIGVFGEFDLETLTYRNRFKASHTLVLNSNLRQRNSTKRYNARITAVKYQTVESISLASSLTKLNFSNNQLSYSLGVYTYPSNSTNKNIRVEFVRTNGNPYSNMLTYSVNNSERERGVYTIDISCERFFQEYQDSIVDINDSLTGNLYIYPAEWGDSYTSIQAGQQPIKIEIQFRNGSKANPYLLETAEDVLNINANEITLRSHYEISSVIDMSAVSGFAPIGILNGKVVGFSGSIKGTNSQASITNIMIGNSNFYANVENKTYLGLFAQINADDSEENVIENVSFSGKINANLSQDSYIGLLASVNKANLLNVGVRLGKSDISTKTQTKVYFGGLVGVNYGNIIQDFEKCDREKQSPKSLAYFSDKTTIMANSSVVFAGGIAGVSAGTIERKLSNNPNFKLYGYSSYSAFTSIEILGTSNFTNYQNLYFGGAVGAVVNSGARIYNESNGNGLADILPETEQSENVSLINLLVGGEITCASNVGYVDYVGGIAGYVDTNKLSKIDILKNTSRVFVRGVEYVGGIVGYDFYNDQYGFDRVANFGNEANKNIIEAIDDGRNSFYSSLMIKFKKIEGLGSNQLTRKSFYAVGNSSRNGRSYTSFVFGADSYLKRNKVSVSNSDKIITNTNSVSDYYGDYIIVEKNSDNTYSITNAITFDAKDVSLGLGESSFAMKSTEASEINLFFMYYFGVQGDLNGKLGQEVQDEIEELNFIAPNSQFYPFSIQTQDVTITSATQDILSIDLNGNLIVKKTGLATLKLTSILNVMSSQTVYIYVVNYFDKNIKASMFYTSANTNSVNITDNSNLTIFGNSNTNIHVISSYELNDAVSANGNEFSISKAGILTYKNVSYLLSKNTQMSVDIEETKGDFSVVQVNKQTVVFFKDKNSSPEEDDLDRYLLTPMLQITVKIGNKDYVFVYELDKAQIGVNVLYRDSATAIYSNTSKISMQTNNEFKDFVAIESTNQEEMLFYQIFNEKGELVQDRLPENIGMVEDWGQYINALNGSKDSLFDLTFTRRKDEINVFDYTCKVNTLSEKFLNRFSENIFGEYNIYLYATELEDGIASTSFKILLDEAELNYVSINNFSNLNDVSVSDNVVVPSQRGMLEISVDPVEAVFEEFTVSNNSLNYQNGATEASFAFMYEKLSANKSVEYVSAPTFGRYENGKLQFTYQELSKFYSQLNESFKTENEDASVNYTGKIFISYYMPSVNVDDGVNVGFDVNVKYGNEGEKEIDSSIFLTTKLGSYAKLVFDDKQEFGGAYYVARGLQYGLTLDSYGFSENQISISSSNENIAKVEKENGKYVLKITQNNISYNNDVGFKVDIETTATKVVDNVQITTHDTMSLYVMEYVMNYVYVEGVNEDIVRGMQDGVVNIAVGNPFELEFAIREFLEYDSSNPYVNQEVDRFVADMTQNIEWKVYLQGESETLAQDKILRTDYYYINAFNVTPLRVYNAESDIYHFSANAYYTMRNGTYSYSSISVGANRVYTEFAFDVHEQSTEESPLPIENYQELLEMKDDQWYILLNDIILPGSEYASEHNMTEFKPLTANIAGLDGNGYKFIMAGNYNMNDVSDIGLFSSLSSGSILKNVTITLTSATVFRTNISTFNMGLLVAQNSGIISNALVESLNDASLSVVCSSVANSSYVAGLVANNSGYITNSRSKLNILSNVNLSGFVGQNSGLIASSYFLGGSLKNETNTTSEFTAGFAIENSGKIYASYVSGIPEAGKMYYDGEKNTIVSSNNITGFVYSNTGNIEDCYSNIQLRQSGAFASGFVFENSGSIERSFSTSVLESSQTSNYGFARINNINATSGNIVDCFYLQDVGINESIGEINYDENTDIRLLRKVDFANLDNFKNFVVANGRDINSVWFFNTDVNDKSNFNGSIFNTDRIELVASNIVATSKRKLDRIENIVDDTTGATYANYIYIYESGYPALGSVYNPILISSAENMEDYILQENNSANYNYSHYRLICDIDYSDYIYNSKLYTTRFMGYLEGNYMSISGLNLMSSDSMVYAGMFAEVGKSGLAGAVGTIINLDYNPSVVSFSNTNVVGALAGRLDGGNVINVNVGLNSTEQIVVVGNNVVGGVVGLALGNYKIQNVYTQHSAKARNQDISLNSNNFDVRVNNFEGYSFAGAMAGVLSGNGNVYNCVIDKAISVLAAKAGLMFGFVDSDVKVEKIEIDILQNTLVNAYNYGGFVAGESRGSFKDVQINGTSTIFQNFKQIPSIPEAVGGFAGLVSGGIIDKVSMTQSIQVSEQSSDHGVLNLGGLVGKVTASAEIKNILIDSVNLIGFTYVGGLVGSIENNSDSVSFENIVVENVGLAVYGHKLVETAIGGIVGMVNGNGAISLTTNLKEGNFELGGKLYAQNEISTSVATIVYSFNSKGDVDNYVGGVIGFNNSSASQTVENTYMNITGSVAVHDMTEIFENIGATLKVEEKEGKSVLVNGKVSGEEIISAVVIASITSGGSSSESTEQEITPKETNAFYCDISYSRPPKNADVNFKLVVTLYGNPILNR